MAGSWDYCIYNLISEKTAVKKNVVGAVLKVEVICGSCGYKYACCSSPMVEGSRLYELNYSISCAILFGGALATKALRYGWKQTGKYFLLVIESVVRLVINCCCYLYWQSIWYQIHDFIPLHRRLRFHCPTLGDQCPIVQSTWVDICNWYCGSEIRF